MVKCRWCDAAYSTAEETARHENHVGYHLAERLRIAEAMLKDALIERDQMRQTLTEAQASGSALNKRLEEAHAIIQWAFDLLKVVRRGLTDAVESDDVEALVRTVIAQMKEAGERLQRIGSAVGSATSGPLASGILNG